MFKCYKILNKEKCNKKESKHVAKNKSLSSISSKKTNQNSKNENSDNLLKNEEHQIFPELQELIVPQVFQDQIILKLKEICYKRQLKILKVIGKGSFGNIVQCIYRGNDLAAKIIVLKKSNKNKFKEVQEKLQLENNLSLNVHNKNIVKTYFIESSEGKDVYVNVIAMERAENRNLSDLTYVINIKNFHCFNNFNKNIKHTFFMSESLVKFFMYQISFGLHYLNENNLVHLDIKLENILIFSRFIPKISDFSLVEEVNLDDEYNDFILKNGTRSYLPPSYYKKGQKVKCNQMGKIDIYSIGVMMYIMFFKENLVKVKHVDVKSLTAILEEAKNEIDKTKVFGDNCKMLMKKLLSPEEIDRPDIFELINDNWFQDIKEIDYIHEVFNGELEKLLLELQKCERYFQKKPGCTKFNEKKRTKAKKYKIYENNGFEFH